jgi:hypothetical protein
MFLSDKMEHRMMTDEEREAKYRESSIKWIKESGPLHMTGWEDLPNDTRVRVTYTLSYDPLADEFLEAEHRYGRIAGRPEYELAADGAS